jgi:hypothetical protein
MLPGRHRQPGHGFGLALRLAALLTSLRGRLRVQCSHRRLDGFHSAGQSRPTGIQGRPIFQDATANDGAKTDRGGCRRRLPLPTEFRRILRDRFTRTKEIGPDLEFREGFICLPPAVNVGLDLRLTKRWNDIGLTISRHAPVTISGRAEAEAEAPAAGLRCHVA